MVKRMRRGLYLAFLACLIPLFPTEIPFHSLSDACCPIARMGKHVVNADQTVIMIWDQARQTQHFIRKASFVASPEDFGFIVPTPSQPELAESRNEAFDYFHDLTKPKTIERMMPNQGMQCGCAVQPTSAIETKAVMVLERKQVAGFDAAVLSADSAADLNAWLATHGFQNSPAIEAWAKPYVEQGWKFTALKIATQSQEKGADPNRIEPQGEEGRATNDATTNKTHVDAQSLRISFKTDRPLFPYREPDSQEGAGVLQAKRRTLRIFFVADSRMEGTLTQEEPWTGRSVWSKPLSEEQKKLALEKLNLPSDTGPADWRLTEFEDAWPYATAPSDLYFSRSSNQSELEKPPMILYVRSSWSTDPVFFAFLVTLVLPSLRRLVMRKPSSTI